MDVKLKCYWGVHGYFVFEVRRKVYITAKQLNKVVIKYFIISAVTFHYKN